MRGSARVESEWSVCVRRSARVESVRESKETVTRGQSVGIMCCKRYSPSTIQFSGDLLLCHALVPSYLKHCSVLAMVIILYYTIRWLLYNYTMLYVIFSYGRSMTLLRTKKPTTAYNVE